MNLGSPVFTLLEETKIYFDKSPIFKDLNTIKFKKSSPYGGFLGKGEQLHGGVQNLKFYETDTKNLESGNGFIYMIGNLTYIDEITFKKNRFTFIYQITLFPELGAKIIRLFTKEVKD